MIEYTTIVGGVVAAPNHRTVPSGNTVADFRIAQSDSKKNEQGGWDTTDQLYVPVVIWNDNPQYRKNPIPWADLAVNLQVGQTIAVHGKLITRQWEAKDGSTQSRIELKADSFYIQPEAPQGNQAQGNGFGGQQQSGGWGQPAPTGGFGSDQPNF